MPHTLRSVDLEDETIAELEMIVGFDDDLAGEATRISNRLQGLLTQIHPSLERVLGPRVRHPAVLKLLDQFGSPAQIRKAGRQRIIALIHRRRWMAERLVEDIFTALDEQTVVVPGTDAAALIVPSLTNSLRAVLSQRKLLATRIKELLENHPPRPHNPQLWLLDPRRTTVPARNKQLKRAFFLYAFAALADPVSRTYYDKKISPGKHHTQALLCLARRRADVLFAMLRDGTFYDPQPAPSA